MPFVQVNDPIDSYDAIQVRKNSVIVYRQSINRGRSKRQIENEINLTRGIFNGYMSPKTKSKISKMLTLFIDGTTRYVKQLKKDLNTDNLYVTFVTLTLSSSQKHSDCEVKRKVFGRFLEQMESRFSVGMWFWRAESQKNGNIHFHCLFDKFIPKNDLNYWWDYYQSKLDYLDEPIYSSSYSSPSTQIEKLKSKTNSVAYVLKYVTKVPAQKKDKDGNVVSDFICVESRSIEGRIWGCSEKMKQLKPFTDFARNYSDFLVSLDFDPDVKREEDKDADYVIYKCNTRQKMLKYDKALLFKYNRETYDNLLYSYSFDSEKIVESVDIKQALEIIQEPLAIPVESVQLSLLF